MTGADYVALRRLSTRSNTTLALPGETCARVPAESLAALLASGKIAPIAIVAPTVAPTKTRKAKIAATEGEGD